MSDLLHRLSQVLQDWKLGMGGVVGVFGIVLLFKDLVWGGLFNVLWANDFDPRLIYWIVNWGYHIIFEQGQPFSFWNANSFYPHPLTLAYSDSLLGIQLFFAPLRALGVPPLVSLYIALAQVCLVGTMITNYALSRMRAFSLVESALISFSAHFGLSLTSFLYHYQLFGFQLAPPFFLFLYLYLQRWELVDLAFLLLLFTLGVCISTYLAPMLFVLSVVLIVPFVMKQIKQVGVQQLLERIGIGSLLAVTCCMVVLYFVQFRPYIEVTKYSRRQSVEEAVTYSANVGSLFTGYSKFSYWYGPEEYSAYGEWEYAYFPGFVLLSSILLYSVALLVRFGISRSNARSDFKGKWFSRAVGAKDDTIEADFLSYMAILFLSSLLLSWGPLWKSDQCVRLPFYYLAQFMPGLAQIRAPGRFGAFVGLPLAVFLVASFHLLTANRTGRTLFAFLALMLIVVESLPEFPTSPFSINSRGVYEKVAQHVPQDTPLLELPVSGKDSIETIKIAMEQLDGSTIHWCKLVVGYGADKTTPQYREILHLDNMIQSGQADPIAAVEVAEDYDIRYLLVHTDRYEPSIRQQWQERLYGRGIIVFRDDGAVLLRLPESS